MNKDEFSKRLADGEEGILSDDEIRKILVKSLSPEAEGRFKGYTNMIIAIEEFSECNKEVTKVLRGKADRINLIEELADAQLSIQYIQEICGISDDVLKKAISIKMKRVSDTLKETNNWG